MLYESDPGTRICDCEGLRDDLDLARRSVPQLADQLNDGSRSVAERLSLALDSFCANPPSHIIFERARYIGKHAEALEFLTQLLERRPPQTTVVLSSREGLPVRLTRFAAPHEIVVLRAADLAFDLDEQRSLLAPFITDASALARIARVSEGWPIALFLLQRFAREGRLEKLLEHLGDVAFGELHDYLVDEVLSIYDSRTLQALFACAAMPHATDADVRDVFPEALSGDALAEFAKESPFLRRDRDGRYRVHPLVAAAVLEHQEERRRLLVAQLALAREAEGDYLRATELQIASGECDGAASALARYDVLSLARPPERYLRLLRRFDASQLSRYPHLFGIHALMRLFRDPPQVLLDELESM
jgi:ATP/maltotriose-dependent transcriptional regulator MalT